MLHRIANGLALAPPLAATVAMADTDEPVFRIEPEPLVAFVGRARKGRLVADEGSVVVDQMDPPPARITTEESEVATSSLYKARDIAPHRLAPVFIMTNADKEPIAF